MTKRLRATNPSVICLMAFWLIIAWIVPDEGSAYCKLPDDANTSLDELDLYAAIAQASYDPLATDTLVRCDSSEISEFSIARLSEDDLAGIARTHARRRNGDDSDDRISIEWHDDGVISYASCGKEIIRLGVIPIDELEPNGDGGFFRVVTGVLFSLFSRDQTFHFIPADAGDDSKGIAVKGTDFENHEEVATSTREIIGQSCALDLAISVTDYFFHDKQESKQGYNDNMFGEQFFVTGHSLGGMVAQHVARNLRDVPIKYFAYSSIGMKPSDDANDDPPDLYSYYVLGDIGTVFGDWVLKREQTGYVMEYKPTAGDSADPIERHSLDYVRESICKCMVGGGAISIWNGGS